MLNTRDRQLDRLRAIAVTVVLYAHFYAAALGSPSGGGRGRMAVGGELSGHRGFRRPALPVAAAHACHATGVEPNARLELLSGRGPMAVGFLRQPPPPAGDESARGSHKQIKFRGITFKYPGSAKGRWCCTPPRL
jgi:hypothetical protein